MLQKIKMFGLELVNGDVQLVVDEMFEYLSSDEKDLKLIFTPNNEILVKANKDKAFLDVLSKAWLNLPDSTGVYMASRLLSPVSLRRRITGVDTTVRFLEMNRKYKVFLLGGANGVAKEVEKLYPDSVIVGTSAVSADPSNDTKLVNRINKSGAEVLFVAFGAPKQEFWLDRNYSELKNVKIAMGVGGTFDFITGKQKRAPSVMRKLGLEWLWRFAHDPKRSGRMFNALVKFPWLVLKEKIKS